MLFAKNGIINHKILMLKPQLKLNKVFGAILLSSLLLISFAPHQVSASTYGSDSYGDCQYSNGCASSGGSDNSGTPSNSTPAANVILLNDFSQYFAGVGKDLTLDQGEVIYFDLTVDGAVQRHSITIQTIGDDSVDLVINSQPIQAHLVVGETEQYDVAGKGENNIQIRLTAITDDGKALMNFKALAATTSPAQTKPKLNRGFTLLNIHFDWWVWILLGSLCLVIGFFILFFVRRHRRKKEQQLPPPMKM